MNLNDLRLPPQLLVDLYSKMLIESPASNVPATDNKITFLGQNDKQVLVLTQSDEHVYLAEEELAFLTTILTACHLGLTDIALVNIKRISEMSLSQINTQIPFKTVLLFDLDVDLLDLPMRFPEFQVQQYNGVTYMHAPALNVIEKDKELKRQLWTALKKIFRID